jgi:hypothetical protein
MDAEYQRGPEHAFGADDADFETGPAIDRGDERDEAAGGKVSVMNRPLRLREHLAKLDFDRLTALKQTITIATR